MDRSQLTGRQVGCLFAVLLVGGMDLTTADAQVRSKAPDRGSYRSPVIEDVMVEPVGAQRPDPRPATVQTVSHQDSTPGQVIYDEPATATSVAEYESFHVAGESFGCDSFGCDDAGCDGGCCQPRGVFGSNARLCFSPDQWFGSAELLLLVGRGDRLPPLLTSTIDATPDADTAGELGQNDTVFLFGGGDPILRDARAGVRLTLGTWLDDDRCRSLVARGFYLGGDTETFTADDSAFPVLARPFFNQTDGETPAQDTQLIAFPEQAAGFASLHAETEFFGGDLAVRQYWWGGMGGSVDFVWGYQYLQFNENFGIATTSRSLDDGFAPLGSVISVTDDFDVENEFHGGLIGLASHYRERCWSLDILLKVGFGSLQRRADLTGSTRVNIGAAVAVDDQGLLVRDSNAGVQTDHTFGWVPELDIKLGWQRWPAWEATVGYNVIALTDALQVSGAIDRDLASNLADPMLGTMAPSGDLRFRTYFVQGVTFGLQHVY